MPYFSVVCLLACLLLALTDHLAQIAIFIKDDDSITQEAIMEHWGLILLHVIMNCLLSDFLKVLPEHCLPSWK